MSGWASWGRVAELAVAFGNSLKASNIDIAALNKAANSLFAAVGMTLLEFGAVGDGIADDTAAVLAAMKHGGPVDWLNKTYRITTGIDARLAGSAVWKSKGATIKLDSAVMHRRAVNVELDGYSLTIRGTKLIVDASQKAVTALRIVNSSLTEADLIAEGLVARSAFRADKSMAGGDGMFIAGNFGRVILSRPEVHDCFMAVGAEVFGSQGIFGLSVAGLGDLYARHIVIRDAVVRNVWSLDPAYINDQDGIRIFQAMTNPDATCLIDGYTCENVANRAVKLHSAPNATIKNVRRVLDAAVVPQTVDFSNPDFDAQQAPAIFESIKVHYNGRCHTEVIRAATDRGDYRFGGSQIDGLSILVENLAGNAIRAIGLTSTAGDAGTVFPDSYYRTTVNNVTTVGPISKLMTVNLRGAGTNFFAVSNIVAELTAEAFSASGSSTAGLVVVVSSIINTGAAVPLATGFGGLRTVTASGQHGLVA